MSRFARLLLTTSAMLYIAHASPTNAAALTLEEAAKKLSGKVPKSMIVTAEADAEKVQYAVSGKDKLPEKVSKEDILFEIGSITKVFNGLLLAQAVVEGKITLDTPLKRALGFKEEFEDPRVAEITPLQLVTHTSGLPRLPANMGPGSNPEDPYAHYDHDLLCAALKSTQLPGDGPFKLEYSNFAAGLLGAILASVYDTTWENLVATKITGPLGMKDTVVTLNKDQQRRFATPYDGGRKVKPWKLNALVGAGGLRSTAKDMVIFGRALNDPDSTPLNHAIKLLMKPQTTDEEMGLGIFIGKVDKQTIYEHGGGTGGFRTHLRVIPETKKVYVVLINDAKMEGASVIAAMREEEARQKESDRALSAEQLSEYEGIYIGGQESKFTLVRRDGQLMARLTGQAFLPVFPHETADRFFYKAVAAELQFLRNKDKGIESVVLHQNGRELPFKKDTAQLPKITFHTEAELKEYSGTYSIHGASKFQVSVHGDTLYAKLDSQPAFPVFETQKDWFDYDVVAARLVFERNKEGKIQALQLYQNGMVIRGEKKAEP